MLALLAGLHFPAHSFRFPKDPQQVTAKYLADVIGAITTIEQRLGDLWEIRR